MPRFPGVSAPASAVPASIFARLVEKLRSYKGEVFPFHLGDTHLDPPPGARLYDLDWTEDSTGKLYRYAAPEGDLELITAIVRKLADKNGIVVERSNVQVTAGATHAFACATRALLDPDDEVLVLAPYWPLIRGQVLSVGARPVEVQFSSILIANPNAAPGTLIEPFVTPRTCAIYLITPNNPDGKVLGERELAAIADIARRHDLWVLADEVYEDFAFDARRHVSIATLPGMSERTLTIFSFSKSYAQAGLRVGYVVGPAPTIATIRKLANHSVYNVPRAMQRAALAALEGGEAFLAHAKKLYVSARDATLVQVPIACACPEGGSYVFMNLAELVAPGEDAVPVLERLAAAGILLAPGYAFGRDFGSWARLCYTSVPAERLCEGLARMSKVLRG